MKALKRGVASKGWSPSAGIGGAVCHSKTLQNKEGLCDGCAAAKERHERDGMRNDAQSKARGSTQVIRGPMATGESVNRLPRCYIGDADGCATCGRPCDASACEACTLAVEVFIAQVKLEMMFITTKH